ncbi:MAG TPA: bifunctional DNA-formamidopyrimidine glycosylase/DNA-(apurinic or apyrimidinic site) lyase [Mycobacteriales bacterium]|nr:bifunctional DNA-formamidopyrimidine glycosylase/DNA-(apurinic or apyrimidinic site) lyase [Mycobacteriales bacterium]
MPELPEVEVVRRGLALGVAGRDIAAVTVGHPRATRRHELGAPDFSARLAHRHVRAASRRGKYLWLPLELDSGEALMAHLGMSGQLLVVAPDTPPQVHLRVRFTFTDGGRELRFVDQRTFGGLAVVTLVPDGAGGRVPQPVAHIARDPLDPLHDQALASTALRRRRTGLKRALLDQTLVSGIGNIYADESLWRARLHGARPTETLTSAQLDRLWTAVHEVLTEALAAGGTSFDALYVSTDGVSGLFERQLAVYGRAGEPCPRCGTPIRREAFMNRSSYSCPSCQPRPRRARW